jgi:hypothetical protein
MTRQHIQELGYLIEVGDAKEPAHPGNTRVIVSRLLRIGFRIDMHGPEFETGERPTQEPYPFLNKEDGSAGIQPDE